MSRRSRWLPAAFFVLSCGLAFSCGGGGDGAEGGGQAGQASSGGKGSITFSSYCESDKECRGSNQLCDKDQNLCVDCLGDVDCGSTAVCQRGACVDITPCKSSKDCPADEVCSGDLSYCVQCVGDNDCGGGERCLRNSCLTLCSSDKDCPDTVCDAEAGECVDCLSEGDCGSGEYCDARVCRPTVCPPGDAQCADGTLVRCDDDGGGFTSSTCSGGCNRAGTACGGACPEGDEGCDCYPNDTCNGDLTCVGGSCVASSGSGGSGGAGTGGEGDGGSPAGGTGGSPAGGTGGSSTGGAGGSSTGGTGGTGGTCAGTTGSMCTSIPRFTGTQVVDGVGDDFCDVPAVEFDYFTSGYKELNNLSAQTSTSKATVRVAWDNQAVRAHVHVVDPDINSVTTSSYFNGDNVQFFLLDSKPVYGSPYQDNSTHFSIVPVGSVGEYLACVNVGDNCEDPPALGQYAARTVLDGYEVEMEWPWPGTPPTAGDQISWNVQIGVNDLGGVAFDYEYGYANNSPKAKVASCDRPSCDTGRWCTPTLAP